MTSFAFYAGCAAVATGVQDIMLGIQSLASGTPINIGDWALNKVSFIANAVSEWMSQSSPRTKAAMNAIRKETNPSLFENQDILAFKNRVNNMENELKNRYIDREMWDNALLTVKSSLNSLFASQNIPLNNFTRVLSVPILTC
jgi:hypothetical protein